MADYLTRILNKDAFDRSGLIYGLGHAVYTKTDPRCEVFRAYVNHLAAEKGREDELALYANVEKIGKRLLMERQDKSVLSTNIDFYSGFVYEMLGLPKEAVYAPVRRGPYRRLECPPDGGALRGRQADPPPGMSVWRSTVPIRPWTGAEQVRRPGPSSAVPAEFLVHGNFFD